MHIAVTTEEARVILELRGRFDACEVDEVRAHIDAALESDIDELVFRMADVSFIDSKALALLVRYQNVCRDTGVKLTVSSVSQALTLILELTKLDRFLGLTGDSMLAEAG